jgi:hypothetical protein
VRDSATVALRVVERALHLPLLCAKPVFKAEHGSYSTVSREGITP